MKGKDLTENVRLYRLSYGNEYGGTDVVDYDYTGDDEPVRKGVEMPELQSVVALKVSAKTFTIEGQYGRRDLAGWYRTPAEAWAEWRERVTADIAEAEQKVKDLHEYLGNGDVVAALPAEQQIAAVIAEEIEEDRKRAEYAAEKAAEKAADEARWAAMTEEEKDAASPYRVRQRERAAREAEPEREREADSLAGVDDNLVTVK